MGGHGMSAASPTLARMPLSPITRLPSKSAIDRAGNALTASSGRRAAMDIEDVEAAVQIVTDFRAAHAYPLQKVRYGLRSFIRTEEVTEALSQRLKRVPRIIRKLDRMGSTRLSTLEDIGGCRAVFASYDELERVRQRLVRAWRPKRERDYAASPKSMGYRAYHATVIRDGRAIEVQLRTVGQQQWAEAVEAADARLALNLKDEDGPVEMQRYFRLAAEVINGHERGMIMPDGLLAQFEDARRAVIETGYYAR